MAKCIFENLTQEQAAVLAEWFEWQGEQEYAVWFDKLGISYPSIDYYRDGGFKEILDNGDVVVHCIGNYFDKH
jgi:hypothetical protein